MYLTISNIIIGKLSITCIWSKNHSWMHSIFLLFPSAKKRNPVNRPLSLYKWYKNVLQINHEIILPAKWSPLFPLKPQISFLQGPKYNDLIVSFTTEQSIIPLITIIIIYFLIHWDLFGFKTLKKFGSFQGLFGCCPRIGDDFSSQDHFNGWAECMNAMWGTEATWEEITTPKNSTLWIVLGSYPDI